METLKTKAKIEKEDSRKRGEFFTPPSLAKLCQNVLNLQEDEFVFDPCLGKGALQISMPVERVYGMEIFEENVNASPFEAILGNSLEDDIEIKPNSVFLTNPPFGQNKKSELFFIKRLIDLGFKRGISILGAGSAYRYNKAEILLREIITPYVKAIYYIPKNVFEDTTIPTIVIEYDASHKGPCSFYNMEGYFSVKRKISIWNEKFPKPIKKELKPESWAHNNYFESTREEKTNYDPKAGFRQMIEDLKYYVSARKELIKFIGQLEGYNIPNIEFIVSYDD